MGFRFRKTVKIAPGVKVNFGKKGASVTVGNKYARTTIGKGRQTVSASIPGTGISYSKRVSTKQKRPQRQTYATAQQLSVADIKNLQAQVSKHNAYIEMLTSVHLEVTDPIDWHIAANEDLAVFENDGPNATAVKNELSSYSPTFIDRLFKREHAKRTKIENKLIAATIADNKLYLSKQQFKDFGIKIINNDNLVWIDVLKTINPFDDIENFGSNIIFKVVDNKLIVNLIVSGENVVPKEVLSLTAANKLSKKAMTKTKYLALYQDYISSCVLRIAREVFAILHINQVLINVYDFSQADSPPKRGCVLSARVHRQNLTRLNFETIDCSDTIETFEHNMNYLKTKGFRLVGELL